MNERTYLKLFLKGSHETLSDVCFLFLRSNFPLAKATLNISSQNMQQLKFLGCFSYAAHLCSSIFQVDSGRCVRRLLIQAVTFNENPAQLFVDLFRWSPPMKILLNYSPNQALLTILLCLFSIPKDGLLSNATTTIWEHSILILKCVNLNMQRIFSSVRQNLHLKQNRHGSPKWPKYEKIAQLRYHIL